MNPSYKQYQMDSDRSIQAFNTKGMQDNPQLKWLGEESLDSLLGKYMWFHTSDTDFKTLDLTEIGTAFFMVITVSDNS